jgi:hypothetical protein
MPVKLHTEIFPEVQQRLFDTLSEQDWMRPFYLAGGTALALQIGHRRSIDFDFFTSGDFDIGRVVQHLRTIGKFELFDRSEGTLSGALNDVRVSFFSYGYPMLEGLNSHSKLSIADMLDIALMKLEAISGRGSKKDFIDLFFLLKRFSLSGLLHRYPQKFGVDVSNHYHLMKSLVYFEDAEHQPMPLMLQDVSWEDIKSSIISEVRKTQRADGIQL